MAYAPLLRRRGFDVQGFLEDLYAVLRQRGYSVLRMAQEAGVSNTTFTHMAAHSTVPDGITLAAVCKWAGLDAAKYSIDLEQQRIDRLRANEMTRIENAKHRLRRRLLETS